METCSLLATLVQNHPHCQRIIVQAALQEKLLQILDQSTNPELQTKVVTAISGMLWQRHPANRSHVVLI